MIRLLADRDRAKIKLPRHIRGTKTCTKQVMRTGLGHGVQIVAYWCKRSMLEILTEQECELSSMQLVAIHLPVMESYRADDVVRGKQGLAPRTQTAIRGELPIRANPALERARLHRDAVALTKTLCGSGKIAAGVVEHESFEDASRQAAS